MGGETEAGEGTVKVIVEDFGWRFACIGGVDECAEALDDKGIGVDS
jgi:hypothetical protein